MRSGFRQMIGQINLFWLRLSPIPPIGCKPQARAQPKEVDCFMGAYSKLHDKTFSLLRQAFPEFAIRENVRPDWLVSSRLTKLELDIFIEEIKIAFEIQGPQHFEYIPYFHKNIDDFEDRKMLDEEKRNLCKGNGIKLIEIITEMDAVIAVNDLEKKYFIPLEKYVYSDCSQYVLEARMLKRFKKKLILLKKKDIVPAWMV
jgi:hypothetical protein